MLPIDPWLAAQIDLAIAPYRKLWPPEAVEAFRIEMAATFATHPEAQRLLREARPDKTEASGEVRVGGNLPEADVARAAKAGRAGGAGGSR